MNFGNTIHMVWDNFFTNIHIDIDKVYKQKLLIFNCYTKVYLRNQKSSFPTYHLGQGNHRWRAILEKYILLQKYFTVQTRIDELGLFLILNFAGSTIRNSWATVDCQQLPLVLFESSLYSRARIVYLLACHVPFIANGAVRDLHRAINHMTDQHIYFSD